MQCRLCRRELAAAEPVYRVAVGYGFNTYRKFGGAVCLLCGGCALTTQEASRDFRDQQWRAPEPCIHCSRPVILNGRRGRPRHVVCGDQCRNAIYSKLAVVRRRRLRPATEHVCANCGEGFTGRSNAVCCSPVCRDKAYYRRLRPATEHVCANCGEGFTGRNDAIYCSLSCRQKAYYRRSQRHRRISLF